MMSRPQYGWLRRALYCVGSSIIQTNTPQQPIVHLILRCFLREHQMTICGGMFLANHLERLHWLYQVFIVRHVRLQVKLSKIYKIGMTHSFQNTFFLKLGHALLNFVICLFL